MINKNCCSSISFFRWNVQTKGSHLFVTKIHFFIFLPSIIQCKYFYFMRSQHDLKRIYWMFIKYDMAKNNGILIMNKEKFCCTSRQNSIFLFLFLPPFNSISLPVDNVRMYWCTSFLQDFHLFIFCSLLLLHQLIQIILSSWWKFTITCLGRYLYAFVT